MHRSTLVALAALTLALVAGLLLASPLATRAQSADGVAMAAGPGGVWIVRGDRLYVCAQPLIRTARSSDAPPSQPRCSAPINLP